MRLQVVHLLPESHLLLALCPPCLPSGQGRARPSLAKLYNWRYRALGDLPAVSTEPAFRAANPGFALDFQLIDVPDFNGRGESCPLPYFYQVGQWG